MGLLHSKQSSWPLPKERPEKTPIIKTQLSEDLRQYLFSSLPSELDELLAAGFEKCEDYPDFPDHHYIEGYYHALRGHHNQKVESVHPKFAVDLDRQSAPKQFSAFCEAFRRANAPMFAALQESLERDRNSQTLADVLQRGGHFADLSVQIHWGEEVPADQGWHTDAANSFLHLALSLGGSRALHECRRSPKQTVVTAQTHWQQEGDAYLSSPATFPHSVEYPATEWSNRIVAVQCRLLLQRKELCPNASEMAEKKLLDQDPAGVTASIVNRYLESLHMEGRNLQIPSLAEVQAVEAEMN
eukprot:TRINITY_DN35867_c0_g1_i1.p1 TRINITY_DN35867_c0_g1~~TRINITY_DN35867_c0_g1_i1.p1  ORF type:complete len:300 (-),score=64.79 TRINITY_DN35867_c0_g1_i1:229-1128(-)